VIDPHEVLRAELDALRAAADDELVAHGIEILAGRVVAVSWNDCARAAEAVHRRAQRDEVPVRTLLERGLR